MNINPLQNQNRAVDQALLLSDVSVAHQVWRLERYLHRLFTPPRRRATSLCYQQLASPLVLYCGFDDPRSMGRYETGSRAASPIWVSYMRNVLSRYSRRGFRKPEGVVMADIAARNGKLAGSDTEKSYLLPFRKGNVPDRVDTGERKDRQMLQEIF